jgi:hypothetical protein
VWAERLARKLRRDVSFAILVLCCGGCAWIRFAICTGWWHDKHRWGRCSTQRRGVTLSKPGHRRAMSGVHCARVGGDGLFSNCRYTLQGTFGRFPIVVRLEVVEQLARLEIMQGVFLIFWNPVDMP